MKKSNEIITFLFLVPVLIRRVGAGQYSERLWTVGQHHTTDVVTEVYWPYNNQKFLFVKYGYDWKHPRILVVDTDTWKNVNWFATQEKYSRFYGLTDAGQVLVFQRIRTFLFFTSIKYRFVKFATGENKDYSRKQLLQYIEQHGKLESGKSFHLNDMVLSPDRNYLVARSSLISNLDDLPQKRFELKVFKYREN
ncbi:hypothetical protein [Pseudochryseolinea flava]|uniref:hypothetical protein n=1 Tax=Pseudochryseolinea flava TaxID=2059302 RepID=UPI00105770E0|nr:hypothetical protein [Pseudochryseolinea flava]